MTALMPRPTIEELVRYRNTALELYEVAFGKIAEADAAIKAAHEMARRASPGVNSYNVSHADEVKAFYNAVRLPDRDQYLRVARRLTAINLWAYVIERTELERLMDAEAKEQLRQQMAYVPEKVDSRGQLINAEEIAKGLPEPTVENIVATIEQYAANASTIFKRGIANAFSRLDRRFRSHDGFKVGSRIILTHAFDDWGRLRWGRIRDTLVDVERVFAVLDGKDDATFTSALYALDAQRRGSFAPRQTTLETEYFLIRGFKNGNAHLWFRRDDLVEKVNKLLAEWYGEAIGDARTAEDDPLQDRKTTPAKRYGFFPTPAPVAEQVVDELPLWRAAGEPPLRVLEPSAGTGNLARLAAKVRVGYSNRWGDERGRYTYRAIVDCVEIQPHLAEALRAEGIYGRVFCQDFLTLSPATTGLYDCIIMNPPFDRERDIDHVTHALDFLKPGGTLVAIMSAGTEFRETRKAAAFRALMQRMGAKWYDLPPGSFAEAGTNINTLYVKVKKR